MLHSIAKVLTFLLQPSSLAALAVLAGLAFLHRNRHSRSALWLSTAGMIWFLVAGLSPLSNAMILPLEQCFGTRQPPTPSGTIAGIIILGGFEDGHVSNGRGGLAVSEAAERLTEGLRLAQRLPDAKLIFTGGAGGLFKGQDAALPIRDFFVDEGIEPGRIVLERASRNTFENAVLTRDLVKPNAVDRWILVTSAYHMPRAVATFRKSGFTIIPYPVDFRTQGLKDLALTFSRIGEGLERSDLAAKEWAGLIAYRVLNRIDTLNICAHQPRS